MAFTAGNDINILQATDTTYVGAGAGDDRYLLSPGQLSDGQVINITDAEGANTLQLIGGLTIASSIISATALQLTLSNGAIVNVFGADTFTYEVGGDPLTSTPGVTKTYSEFAVDTLGADAVPETGTAEGDANVTVNADGSTTQTAVVDLQEGTTDPVDADANADEVFTFDVAAALALTDDTQISLNGFDVLNDALEIDSATAAGSTTLDALDGVDGIAVQTNVITNETLINFGVDADGQVVTLTLAGIVDPSLINVNVV